jgi:hypothetical protein
MPDMKYQEVVPCEPIEDEIRVTQDRYAPMPGIVDKAADLRKETESVD